MEQKYNSRVVEIAHKIKEYNIPFRVLEEYLEYDFDVVLNAEIDKFAGLYNVFIEYLDERDIKIKHENNIVYSIKTIYNDRKTIVHADNKDGLCINLLEKTLLKSIDILVDENYLNSVAKTFTINRGQYNKFLDWREEKGEVYVGAAGGAYAFSFTPTGLGQIEEVICADGTELDLTEWGNW